MKRKQLNKCIAGHVALLYIIMSYTIMTNIFKGLSSWATQHWYSEVPSPKCAGHSRTFTT